MGGADARWYATQVADHLAQWRAGHWPVFVTQTRFAPAGTVMPVRVAPYLQHLTVALDFATGRSLAPYLLLNLALILSAVAGGVSAYLCLGALMPRLRLEACLLAILYIWSPGVIGLAYTGELFMSAMTVPFQPLVFAGVVLVYRRDDFLGWAMIAAGCAACWLAHPPIGLWISIAAGLALLVRWIGGAGWNRKEGARVALAGLLFAGLCGYVFVSVRALGAPGTSAVPMADLQSMVHAVFPAELEPLSRDAAELSDLQLGYSLWVVLAAGWAFSWTRDRAAARPLALAALALTVLIFPIPWLNAPLWKAMPHTIVEATNTAPMQRLYPVLAACTVTLAACILAGAAPATRRRRWIVLALGLGIAWSGSQLRPLLHRGLLFTNSKEQSDDALLPENIPFSRFSLALLPAGNRFFSQGVTDFALEQRVLGPDLQATVVSNVGAVAPGFDHGPRGHARALSGVFEGSETPGQPQWASLRPTLTLEPGAHYLLAVDFPDERYNGVIQVTGDHFYREYLLPTSGAEYAFGVHASNSRVIPLSSQSVRPLELTLNFISFDPARKGSDFRRFARFELLRYRPGDLPIRQESLVPYAALVRSPQPGWLETFRYSIPGWTATVDGAPSPIRRSPNGLVAVAVPAGKSEVRLRYSPPTIVLAAYWTAWASWAGLAIGLLLGRCRGPTGSARA